MPHCCSIYPNGEKALWGSPVRLILEGRGPASRKLHLPIIMMPTVMSMIMSMMQAMSIMPYMLEGDERPLRSYRQEIAPNANTDMSL